jgi:hypothetical protein
MNLKPTKKKVIWTLVLSIVINVFVPLINWLTETATWSLVQRYLNITQTTGIYEPANITALTSYMISKWNIIAFVLELIIIYFIWSLFQRKRRMSKHQISSNQK